MNKTESKRSKKRYIQDMLEDEGGSFKTTEVAKVSKLALLIIDLIKQNPGITREQIIAMVDDHFLGVTWSPKKN